jgi:hypothetical protein
MVGTQQSNASRAWYVVGEFLHFVEDRPPSVSYRLSLLVSRSITKGIER